MYEIKLDYKFLEGLIYESTWKTRRLFETRRLIEKIRYNKYFA